MANCDALDTDDLVRSACLLGMKSFLLLVSDNCGSILNSEPPSRPLFGPFVALSSAALYFRVIPLDLGHMSSSAFVLYRSQSLSPPSPRRYYHVYLSHYNFLSITRTSFRESVNLTVKLFVTLWRPRNRGSIPSSRQKIMSYPTSLDRLWNLLSLRFNSKWWQIRRSVKLTSHIYPVRRIKMCAAILDSPLFLQGAVKSDLRNVSRPNCNTL